MYQQLLFVVVGTFLRSRRFKSTCEEQGDMSLNRPGALVDADPDTGTYHATYHYPAHPPSIAVALALMEITDSAVSDLDPMYEAASVNTDALDDLFDPATKGTRNDGHVTFTYHNHTVTVKSHGHIVIQSPTSSADSTSRYR